MARPHAELRLILGRSIAMLIVAALVAGTAITAQPRSATAVEFAIGDTVFVETDALNLRSAPALDAEVVTVLAEGTRATITDGPVDADDYTWYELAIEDGASGWAAGEFLGLTDVADPGFTTGTEVVVAVDALNLRTSAGLDADIVAVMPLGARATITGGPVTADGLPWYELEAGDVGEGWSAGGFLVAVPGGAFAVDTTLLVNADGLNLRLFPGLAEPVLAVIPGGSRVTITGGPVAADEHTWHRVDSVFGAGWVASEFLVTVADGIAAGDDVRVADGPLNLRVAPELEAEMLAVLDEEAVLTVTDGPVVAGGYTWFAMSSDAGDGWCAGEFLELL